MTSTFTVVINGKSLPVKMIGCGEKKERAREVSILPTATQCMSTRSTLIAKPMRVKGGGNSNAYTVYPIHRAENY
jgi:hypothetical protein